MYIEKPRDRCGVLGVYSTTGANVTPLLISGLIGLQHRGQESFGIAVNGHPTYKKKGLVYSGYLGDRETIDKISGNSGIGHVRYSTVGDSSDIGNFHPIEINSTIKIRIAHNGTISNTREMRALLRDGGIAVKENSTDTELAGHLLAKFFVEKGSWAAAFNAFEAIQNGSYSFVIQTEKGEIVAARDGAGYKPLCYGYHAETQSFVIASESSALLKIEAVKLKDIMPGELMVINSNGIMPERFTEGKPPALDPFEITYFAHPTSNIDGIQVAIARQNLGRALFNKFKIMGDMVVPVPESANHAAEGYSAESGIPLVHALGKDRYIRPSVLRVFIEPSQRADMAKSLFIIAELVRGKDVVVIDDSIVRGESSQRFIRLFKSAGARSISLLSTFPPIRYSCFMGIDFPSRAELIAFRIAQSVGLEEVGAIIAKEIGINFVGYLDPMTISRAIGVPVNSLCFSCVTGNYSKLKFNPRMEGVKEKA